MTSAKETQRQTILHLWNQGITNGQEIHRRTNIPLATIYKNIKKLKKTGSVAHAKGNGRPKKITGEASKHWDNIFEEILLSQPEHWQIC